MQTRRDPQSLLWQPAKHLRKGPSSTARAFPLLLSLVAECESATLGSRVNPQAWVGALTRSGLPLCMAPGLAESANNSRQLGYLSRNREDLVEQLGKSVHDRIIGQEAPKGEDIDSPALLELQPVVPGSGIDDAAG